MSLDVYSEILQNEIELLKVIYEKEFSISFSQNNVILSINLPLESIKDSQKNFINIKVEIICDIDYPNSIPEILFSNYWGLEDNDIGELYRKLRAYLSIGIAEPEALIFNSIDKIIEQIDDNIPKCKCSICLDYFVDAADIFVTPLHHYFHESCIGNYAVHQMNEHDAAIEEAKRNNQFITDNELPRLNMKCPVCRAEDLIFERPPRDGLDSWRMTSGDDSDAWRFLSEEIIDCMKTMSLKMEQQRRQQRRRQINAAADSSQAGHRDGVDDRDAVRGNAAGRSSRRRHHRYRGDKVRRDMARERDNNETGAFPSYGDWRWRGDTHNRSRGRWRHSGQQYCANWSSSRDNHDNGEYGPHGAHAHRYSHYHNGSQSYQHNQ